MVLIYILAVISAALSLLTFAQFLKYYRQRNKLNRILLTALSALTLFFGFLFAGIFESTLKTRDSLISDSLLRIVEFEVKTNYLLSLVALGFILLIYLQEQVAKAKQKYED